jgi:hypothetical protein
VSRIPVEATAAWLDWRVNIALRSASIFRVHLWLIALLVGLHGAARVARRVKSDPNALGLWPMFNLNAENNVPALFASMTMLAVAGLLFATSRATPSAGQSSKGGWITLGCAFVFLAIDEAVGLHERLNRPVRAALGVDGALHFAWVIPYALLTLVLVAGLARFLLALDSRTRRNFFVAGAVYLTGAIVLEMVGARIWVAEGPLTRAYFVGTTCEETLEMLGIALFTRAILAHHERLPEARPVASPSAARTGAFVSSA